MQCLYFFIYNCTFNLSYFKTIFKNYFNKRFEPLALLVTESFTSICYFVMHLFHNGGMHTQLILSLKITHIEYYIFQHLLKANNKYIILNDMNMSIKNCM